MISQIHPRVLIVDNDPRVGRFLKEILENKQYLVQVANGVGKELMSDALRISKSFRPHAAVIDLRIGGAQPTDKFRRDDLAGLELLRDLVPARCILRSAYLTPEITRLALKTYKAFDVIGAQESTQIIEDSIETACKEACANKRGFSIHWPSTWNSKQVVDILFDVESDVPQYLADDVLCQSFPEGGDIDEINLEPMDGAVVTPESVSRGRSVVLKVWRKNRIDPLVVKLAPSTAIKKERDNYTKYIEGKIRGRFHSVLEGEPVLFWDLGCILYSFVDAPRQGLRSFTKYYREEYNLHAINQSLKHFFTEVWEDLYADSTKADKSLYNLYNEILNLDKRILEFPNKDKQIHIPGIPVSLLNPVSWVARHKDASDAIFNFSQARTHGDLHGDNLFVDGIHAWAIDFERSGPGPILRDFVELEADIVTRLIPFPENKEDIPAFYNSLFLLAIILVQPTEPDVPFQIPKGLPLVSEFSKALEVIAELRRLSREVTRYSDSREYLWGLLFDSVFIASLTQEGKPQRDRALLLGAVLCERLRHWGNDWPPKGWHPIITDSTSINNSAMKGIATMLPSEQQTALMVLAEATKFLFSELGKKLDFWRQKKGEKSPQIIELESGDGVPIMKFDELEQMVNVNNLYQTQGRIRTSHDILKKLTTELDGHRKQRITDTLLDPRTRAWLDNRIPELEEQISKETIVLQEMLGEVYKKR